MNRQNCFRLITSDSAVDLPIGVSSGGYCFSAEMPALSGDVVEVRLFSDALERPLRFILESFLLDNEVGSWAIRVSESALGLDRFDLEYYATHMYGERIRHPSVFQWNSVAERMEPA
jgi:hypothetical protein